MLHKFILSSTTVAESVLMTAFWTLPHLVHHASDNFNFGSVQEKLVERILSLPLYLLFNLSHILLLLALILSIRRIRRLVN